MAGRERPEDISINVPRRLLERMPSMEEAPLRAMLFMCLNERITPGFPKLVTAARVARGTGVSVARARDALALLVREDLVVLWPDGRYALALAVPPSQENDFGRLGGSKEDGCVSGRRDA